MKKIALLLVLSIFCAWAASASYISLQTTVTSKVVRDVLKVSVRAINQGDESAYNVQAEIRVGEKKILGNKVEELGINGVYRAQASFKLDYKKPGEYPLTVAMHYADANLYPFSALTCRVFSYQAKALPSDLFGSIKPLAFLKKGKAKLILKNMGEADIIASTYLVTPREITVEKSLFEVKIPAKAERSVSFALKNFSALSGSNYQIFAISEYEKDGRHLVSITPGSLQITKEGPGARLFLGGVVLLLLCLVFLLLVYFIKKKK